MCECMSLWVYVCVPVCVHAISCVPSLVCVCVCVTLVLLCVALFGISRVLLFSSISTVEAASWTGALGVEVPPHRATEQRGDGGAGKERAREELSGKLGGNGGKRRGCKSNQLREGNRV